MKKNLASLLLGTSLLFANPQEAIAQCQPTEIDYAKNRISAMYFLPKVKSKTPPRLKKIKMAPNKCARYATYVSRKLFDKKITRANAWDLRYKSGNKVIETISKKQDPYYAMDSLYVIGELKPGMIVGVNNPNSKYNRGKDMYGNKIKYTHVMTFVGEKNGKLVYHQQWGKKIIESDHKWMKKRKICPIEVIGLKKDPDHVNLIQKPIYQLPSIDVKKFTVPENKMDINKIKPKDPTESDLNFIDKIINFLRSFSS